VALNLLDHVERRGEPIQGVT